LHRTQTPRGFLVETALSSRVGALKQAADAASGSGPLTSMSADVRIRLRIQTIDGYRDGSSGEFLVTTTGCLSPDKETPARGRGSCLVH
jgi:hypothetical protein